LENTAIRCQRGLIEPGSERDLVKGETFFDAYKSGVIDDAVDFPHAAVALAVQLDLYRHVLAAPGLGVEVAGGGNEVLEAVRGLE